MILSGWGNYPRMDCAVSTPRGEGDVAKAIAQGPVIARGNGRSYGDSAFHPDTTLDMRGMNRLIGFDEDSGQLVAEAGILLDDILRIFLPKGWFPMVTPGTRFVTLGGMIASDVHGKNHHCDGAFNACLDWIEVMGPKGVVQRCSRDENADLFHATTGGMGLTGVICRAAFRLRRVETGWIRQRSIATPDLESTLAAFEANASASYSVAWIDCLAQGAALGRSILTLGEHAVVNDLPLDARAAPLDVPVRRKIPVPLNAPGFALNRYSVRAFNQLYYSKGLKAAGETLVSWDSYFYPLDAVLNWNRIYGRRGFVQYQCVLPLDRAATGLRQLLALIADSGLGSFLAVLKRMGAASGGAMSFPMEGYTLALDFPATPKTFSLLRRLDEIVIAHGGRIYLAKDSRLSPEALRRSDPRAAEFQSLRRADALTSQFISSQSERLFL